MSAEVILEVNYCPRCGSPVVQAERYGRMRPVCPACRYVHFADPKVAVAVVIEREGKVLLARRANEPRRGFWSLPAGFMDAGEDPARAAERECLEETGLQTRTTGLIDVVSGQEHAGGAHILIVYHAEVISGTLRPGDDVDQVGFFPLDDLPPLAFKTTYQVL